MEHIWEGLKSGLGLLFPLEKDIRDIIILSLTVSGSATVLAGFLGIPCGVFIAMREFRLKRLIISLINTWLALPAVAIGLVVYILLSRSGPLGMMGFLYTPVALIIAQSILAAPIITSLTHSALKNVAKDTRDIAYSLGASRIQMVLKILSEGKFAFMTAMIVGFSRIIGETGMTLMLGGNIKGLTRVLTTAIALETMKGNFELGIALGVVLIAIALVINFILQFVQGK